LLYCNQNFADYPVVLPDGKYDPSEIRPQYFLLSYKKKAEASTSAPDHPAELALDENIRTWWAAEKTRGWFLLDLEDTYRPHSIQINFADHEVRELKIDKSLRSDMMTNTRYIDSSADLKTRFIVEGSVDKENWFVIEDRSQAEDNRCHPYIILDEKYEVRYIRIRSVKLPYDEVFALSGVRVFGKGKGSVPAPVENCRAERTEDRLSCTISFDEAEGAFGYNVRFGIAPDKLYTSYQVYEKSEVMLTTLNADQDYYYAVDSFNENGICEATEVYKM
jgi:hypothetical protein